MKAGGAVVYQQAATEIGGSFGGACAHLALPQRGWGRHAGVLGAAVGSEVALAIGTMCAAAGSRERSTSGPSC